MSVAPGTVLAGKYRIDYALGEGGMGMVVAATDLQLERRVAIKFLLPDYAQHHEASQRFLREARAAVKIQSEHIARVIDVGTMDGGAPYMVMEFLEGKDLAALLDERSVLPVEEAVAYVLEACDAIAEAHSVGIVHRDLKPANLFLAHQPDGSTRIKVLDFGISKATSSTTTGIDPSLTRTSSMMGSPLYMSPEQMKSAKHVDPRTDVWALGVILYEALAGKPPFYAESIPELSAKVLLDQPESLRSLRSDVPLPLEAAVLRALAKTPAERYPTVADFAHALASFGPERTRSNVERAARVLKITGPTAKVDSPPSVVGSKSEPSQASYARTAASWTESPTTPAPPNSKKRSPALFVGAAAGALVVLAAFLVSGGGKGVAPSPSSASAMAPAPLPVAPPVKVPLPDPPRPVVPAPPASVISVVPALPSAAPVVPASASSATSKTAALKPHTRPVAVAKAKPKSKPAPAATPVPAKSAPAPDPFSGFGNRK